jgi:hypothetical protein
VKDKENDKGKGKGKGKGKEKGIEKEKENKKENIKVNSKDLSFGVFDTQSGKAVPSYLAKRDNKKLKSKTLLQVRL